MALRATPLVCIAVLISAACSSGGSASKAASTTVSQAGSAAPVKAVSKGGDFCQFIGSAMSASAAGASLGTGKAGIEAARDKALQAEKLAPSAIKSDVTVLMQAVIGMYDALAKAGYDYTKIDPANLEAMSSPEVVAAEQRLTVYADKSCGLQIGSTAPPSDAAANDDTKGSADPAPVAAGAACALATVDEVSAAAGKAMVVSGDGGAICVFSASTDPSFTLSAMVYEDDHSKALMKELETAGSEHLADLGDDAFWNAVTGTVYVSKGTRGFSFVLASLNNLTSTPDAVKARMVLLAKAGFSRL